MEVAAMETVSLAESPKVEPLTAASTPSTDSMVTVRLSTIKPCEDMVVESVPSSPDGPVSETSSLRSRSTSSSDRSDSPTNDTVDWEELEKSEEQEPRDDATDGSTALLLARLDQENAALVEDPKAGLGRTRKNTRPASIQQLKRLVKGDVRKSLRYSQMPAPPMTELDFWAALVSDYPQTAQRLPTLTTNKIRSGVPPPLRGVVWPSICGANDILLKEEYQRLCSERSPYEGLIGKDVGRSFPSVDMFREKDGEGQRMLGRVLNCFSLYDDKIGYCQGLGFVVGPLLMHMAEADAFCILVRLMEHYDLRSCYLPDLSGLHLRIYQFSQLLDQHLPELSAHLQKLKVEPLYVTQWFLSFFAATCPLPMLLRIYDVILSEGATETLMRVSLSLMKRNQEKIMATEEFEDVMQFLLCRSLWDTYAQQADDLVADFASFTTLVTPESLGSLEVSFKESKSQAIFPSLKSTASQFVGRFWTGSAHYATKSGNNLVLAIPTPSRPASLIRKSPSKQSISSSLSSIEGNSDASTLATEVSSRKSDSSSETTSPDKAGMGHKERELENQVEDLLKALGDMQRQQMTFQSDIQREREERQEDRETACALLRALSSLHDDVQELSGEEPTNSDTEREHLIAKASTRFATENKRGSILQSKHQLRDEAADLKAKHDLESVRCQELMKQLDFQEREQMGLREQLRDARSRIQDSYKDKQRMERAIHDLKLQRASMPEPPKEHSITTNLDKRAQRASMIAPPGLREFRLGRTDTLKQGSFSKRSSSLISPSAFTAPTTDPAPLSPTKERPSSFISMTKNSSPATQESSSSTTTVPSSIHDACLIDLATAKSSEALAKQELEEVRGKLDSLKKIIGGHITSPKKAVGVSFPTRSVSLETKDLPAAVGAAGEAKSAGAEVKGEKEGKEGKSATSKSSISISASAGGFFSGWGRRATSATSPA